MDLGEGASVATNQLPNRPTFAKLGTKRGDVIERANTPDKSNKRRFEAYQYAEGAERVRAYQDHTVPATRPAAHENPLLRKFLLQRTSIQADSEIAHACVRAIGGGREFHFAEASSNTRQEQYLGDPPGRKVFWALIGAEAARPSGCEFSLLPNDVAVAKGIG